VEEPMSKSKKKYNPVKSLPTPKEDPKQLPPNEDPDCMDICHVYFNEKTNQFSVVGNEKAGIDLILAGLNKISGMLLHQVFTSMSAMQKQIQGQQIVKPTAQGVEKFGKGVH
jgi:hypothetical protein